MPLHNSFFALTRPKKKELCPGIMGQMTPLTWAKVETSGRYAQRLVRIANVRMLLAVRSILSIEPWRCKRPVHAGLAMVPR
jgi:hypothetical protein